MGAFPAYFEFDQCIGNFDRRKYGKNIFDNEHENQLSEKLEKLRIRFQLMCLLNILYVLLVENEMCPTVMLKLKSHLWVIK